MDKKSFIIYQNWAKLIENLEDDKAGMLIKAICAYVSGKEVDVQDASINAIFQMIVDKISEDTEKYAEVSQKRREAIEKRWNDTKEYKSIQMNKEVKQKNYDTDTDTETETDTDKDIKGSTAIAAPLPYDSIVHDYNTICKSFPRVNTLSDARKKAIRARIKTFGVDDIHRAFELAERSDFLKGANDRNWSANFDWIMKDANLAKILDGNYDNKGKSPPQDGFEWLSQQIREGGFS